MWNWLTGRHREVTGIKVTHIKAIDSEGSLVIYSEGSSGKRVAALRGTSIYELGTRLRTIVDCDRAISEEVVTLVHPDPHFYFTSQYDINEAKYMLRQEQEERRRIKSAREKKLKKQRAKGGAPSHTTTAGVVDPLDPESGLVADPEAGGGHESEGDLATISSPEVPVFQSEGEGGLVEDDDTSYSIDLTELERLNAIDRAAHQHLVCRLVSGYPVVTMKPFVNEFYSRFVETGSPYVIFDEDVYTVYRLWMNTGLAQSSLCRALIQFLKAKDRLDHLWNIDTMETFLVCNLYNDYEAIFPRLESDLAITRWGQHYLAADDVYAARATSVSARAYDRSRRRARIYALKEVQRLWMYNHSKDSLLQRMFSIPVDDSLLVSSVEGEGIPLHNPMPEGERITVAPDMMAAAEKEKGKQRVDANGNGRGEEKDDAIRANEQYLLQKAIEAQIAASAVHTECWEKVMDPVRKLIIEVRDLCNQVCINQVRQEHPEEVVDYQTDLLRFHAGVVETVHGVRPKYDQELPPPEPVDATSETSTTFVPEGTPPPMVPPPLVTAVPTIPPVAGEVTPPMAAQSLSSPPRISYDPDVPHLPVPTLNRLLTYLDRINDSMLAAVRNQDPEKLINNPHYYSPFQEDAGEDDYFSDEYEE